VGFGLKMGNSASIFVLALHFMFAPEIKKKQKTMP